LKIRGPDDDPKTFANGWLRGPYRRVCESTTWGVRSERHADFILGAAAGKSDIALAELRAKLMNLDTAVGQLDVNLLILLRASQCAARQSS
jgi:hypothetical protein